MATRSTPLVTAACAVWNHPDGACVYRHRWDWEDNCGLWLHWSGRAFAWRLACCADGPCATAAFEGAPEEIDVTVFPADGEAAASAERGAKALVAEAHQARQFTDVASFTLRCAP